MDRRTMAAGAVLLAVLTSAVAVGAVLAGRDDPSREPGRGMMMGLGTATEGEYLAAMVAHHREAVTAAGELARSERPQLRALGAAIVRSQSAQIEQMTTWLARWHPDQPPDVAYRPMMRDLSGRSGDRLDRAFLTDMIAHHMVAVMLSQRLLVSGAEHQEVADLAASIRDDQHAEILLMRRWLAAWFGIGPGGRTRWWMGLWMGPGMGWGGRT